MKYYRYESICIDNNIYSPCDSKGRGVDVLYGDRSEEFGYRSASSIDEAFISVNSKQELKDSMFCHSFYLLVSEQLNTALRGFRLDTDIIHLPVTVKSMVPATRYYMIYCPTPRDPIDYEQSVFEYFPGRPGVIRSVKEYEFTPSNLPAFSLFRTPQYDWIMNEPLVSHLIENSYSGHRFTEIWSC